MEWVVKRNSGNGGPMPGFGGMGGGPTGTDGGENVVRLRGLPFEASKGDIIKFFEGKLRVAFSHTLCAALLLSYWATRISKCIFCIFLE